MKQCTNPNCRTLNPDVAVSCKSCGSPLSGGKSEGEMTFGKAISTCFRKYANFKGRANRAEYWFFYLFSWIISFPFSTMMNIGEKIQDEKIYGIAVMVLLVLGLIILLPSFAVFTRRMHDIGKSGWNILLLLIPIVGMIVILVFLCRKGDSNNNEYGDVPN